MITLSDCYCLSLYLYSPQWPLNLMHLFNLTAVSYQSIALQQLKAFKHVNLAKLTC